MEAEIEVVMVNCIVAETVKFDDGEAEYGIPEIHESYNSHYRCRKCAWKLPLEPNELDDNVLSDWLEQQPYNRNQNEMIVKICNLDEGIAYFCQTPEECRDEVGRSVLELCCKDNECICIGKMIGYPEDCFAEKDRREFERFGLNRIFEI
jgi:hypothetical protein